MKKAIIFILVAMMLLFTSCVKNTNESSEESTSNNENIIHFKLIISDVTKNQIIGKEYGATQYIAVNYDCAEISKHYKVIEFNCKETDIENCSEDYRVTSSSRTIRISKKINNPQNLSYYYKQENSGDINYEKPVIYLYPTEKTEVSVKLDFNGKLTTTYPTYNNGWNVTANPDGTLINHADGKEYSYLYWEGESNAEYDISKGFVVKGSETMLFLQAKLAEIRLTPKEYNEFIVYWLPKMQENKYNLISFQTTAYTENAKLEITPKPDSILRVFMVFKSLEEPIQIEPQTFAPFTRNGFTVVEWGGSEMK